MTILETLRTLVEPGDVVELRVLGVPRVKTVSGYFDDMDAAAAAAERWSGKAEAVYLTLNPVKPALLARAANRMVEAPKSTTSDGDILRRRWLLIDLDPVRPSGISSTHEEQGAALQLARRIADYLIQDHNWPGMLVARSGNGAHLVARVDLPNDDASRDLCKAVLEGLRAEFRAFDAWEVAVDTTTFNAARICTLYGTMKCKGDSTPERPHRRSQLVDWYGQKRQVVPVEALQSVAALAPKPEPRPERPAPRAGRQPDGPFDAEGWLRRFQQVEVLDGPVERSGWTRWYVRCPWNADHAGRDAYLSVSAAGAVTFHCSHNSCAGHDWAALRALVGDNPPPPRPERPTRQPKPKVEVDPGRIVVEPEEWRWTEVGNKERLLAAHGDVLRYDPARGWLVWNGRLWQPDHDAGLARRLCEQVLVAMAATMPAQAALDEDLRKEWAAWCKTSATARMMSAVLQLAQSDVRVRVEEDLWDRDLWAINTQNGILDLRTGQLRPHDREAYCTRITSCDYDPEAKAPLWEACLERWQPSADVRAFLQRHAGYSLTGLTTEQTAVLHYGEGKNGKTIFTGALKHVFGSYAGVVDHAALSDAKRGAGQANPEIARLVGLRFVLGTEIQQGVGFNEALIKDITGGDTVIARMLHTNPIEFDPQFALVLYGNHKPRIKSQDEGIWRRLPLVPWSVVIPEGERDKRLPAKLQAEAQGILAWMVRGCVAWQQEGLNPPAEVVEASAEYRRDEDHFGQFAAVHLVFTPDAWATSHDIRKAYEAWCDAEGFRPWSAKALGDSIARLGGQSETRRVLGVMSRVWRGVALASDRGDEEAPAPEGPVDLELAPPAAMERGAPVAVAPAQPAAGASSEEADPFAHEAAPVATPPRDPSALDVWVRRQFSLPWRTDEDRGITVARAQNLDELLERGEARGFGRQEVVSAANTYATQRATPRDRAWWNQLQAQPRHPRGGTPESRHPSTSSDNPEDWDDIGDPFSEE